MQKKIVYKFPVKQAKCRNMAMKIALGVPGVTSVTIGGEDKDMVIVIGEGVDAFKLTKSLKKNLGDSTTMISMEKLKGDKSQERKDQPALFIGQPSCYNNPPPCYNYNTCDRVVMCDSGPTGCSIL